MPDGVDIQDANGRLIASAPDLLLSLEDALDLLQRCSPDSIDPIDYSRTIDEISRVITKARGGQEG